MMVCTSTRPSLHPSLSDLLNSVRVHELHIFEAQTGEIIRAHDLALAANLGASDQQLAVLCRRDPLDILDLSACQILSNGCARLLIEAQEVLLHHYVQVESVQPHGEGNIAHDPLERA